MLNEIKDEAPENSYMNPILDHHVNLHKEDSLLLY